MTTPEADEPAKTAPSEAPGQQPPPPAVSSPPPEVPSAESQPSPFRDGAAPEPEISEVPESTPLPQAAHMQATAPIPLVAARQLSVAEREVTYVPLAVTVGDGFKFGCGFFLAMVLALLVGFVVLAALFVITGLSGLNLPIGR